MAISDRLENAIKHYANKDYESALLELSPAIDATSKRRQPKDKVGARFKAFIHEHRSFIFFGALGWGVRLVFTGDGDVELDKAENTISKFLYVRARNAMVHDGELDRFKVLEENELRLDEAVGIGRGFILALILAVIVDPVNNREKFKMDLAWEIGKVKLNLNDYWGKFKDIETLLHEQATHG